MTREQSETVKHQHMAGLNRGRLLQKGGKEGAW